MNSFWNKNIGLFKKRFSALFEQLTALYNLDSPDAPEKLDFSFWQVEPSKSGSLTAKENGLFIHSAYNPGREAESIFRANRTDGIQTALFLSVGLGYAPLYWAESAPDDTIIIVEPEPLYFFAALSLTDFSPLFKHEKLILLLQADMQTVPGLVEHAGKFEHTAVIENKAQTAHAQKYFSLLNSLIERNRKKEKINSATFEKFSGLWLKNLRRNLKTFALSDGVNIYKDCCPKNLPCLLISAGPTLSEVLPHLKELKKRCITVAVDTAVRAILKTGFEPDFIVLTDPQYYAYRHIAGLKSPSSVLLTESAAYPPVYRFKCKKMVFMSSLFPAGKYFEEKLGEKGGLGAGGSVSTTAWDFCRLTGTKKIFCAGLDLGYPKLESHIRGSLFEEKSHKTASRLKPAEQLLALSLFGANTTSARDFNGKTLFTDDKMKMFAWWFESQAQKYPEIESFSLSSKSFAIPGFKYKNINEVLAESEKTSERGVFFSTAEQNAEQGKISLKAFEKAYRDFPQELLTKKRIKIN